MAGGVTAASSRKMPSVTQTLSIIASAGSCRTNRVSGRTRAVKSTPTKTKTIFSVLAIHDALAAKKVKSQECRIGATILGFGVRCVNVLKGSGWRRQM